MPSVVSYERQGIAQLSRLRYSTAFRGKNCKSINHLYLVMINTLPKHQRIGCALCITPMFQDERRHRDEEGMPLEGVVVGVSKSDREIGKGIAAGNEKC